MNVPPHPNAAARRYAGPVLNPEPVARVAAQPHATDSLAAESLAAELMRAALSIPTPAALASVRELAALLHDCDAGAVPAAERLALWINLYNALVRYAFHSWQLRGSVIGNLRVFARAAWAIGGERFSLDIIEHGLLRGNARVPPLKLLRTLRARDARLRAAVDRVDPRIHFALNCGARSCPRVRVYRAAQLSQQLEAATREYFASHAQLDQRARRLHLPRLMKYFRGDFGDRAAALRFAAAHLEPAAGHWMLQHASELEIAYTDYDWTLVAVEPLTE